MRKMKATMKIISLLKADVDFAPGASSLGRADEAEGPGGALVPLQQSGPTILGGGHSPDGKKKRQSSIRGRFFVPGTMTRTTGFLRRHSNAEDPAPVRSPFPWYLGCLNYAHAWYMNLAVVPDNAVTADGIMDHNNLRGDDADGSFQKTREALILLLHLPGIMRQSRWPQVLFLPHSVLVQNWSLFILILVLIQSVVVPLEATFDDVQIFEGPLEWASIVAFALDLVFQFIFSTTDDHEKIIVDGVFVAHRYVTSKWFWPGPHKGASTVTFSALECFVAITKVSRTTHPPFERP